MDIELDSLKTLLRTELTAVHQQFFHILVLRQRRHHGELLDRIVAIDQQDFRNAMQIIDLLVYRQVPIDLPTQRFFPGSDVASILAAEFQVERHFAEILGCCQVESPEAEARLHRAAAPRQGYRTWLATQLNATVQPAAAAVTLPHMATLLERLIGLIEQPMLHAFLHWHYGDRSAADAAWRLSGSAMLHATAIIDHCAAHDFMPAPLQIPVLRLADSPAEAAASDRMLVASCAESGMVAADDLVDEEIHRLCRQIVEDCELIMERDKGQDFPAVFGRSPAFDSFSATRNRHLR